MTKCPYCGHQMNVSKELPKMTPREFKLYSLMLSNGREYTTHAEILNAINSDGVSKSSIRVTLHYLNKKLATIGQVITNHNRVGWRIEEL